MKGARDSIHPVGCDSLLCRTPEQFEYPRSTQFLRQVCHAWHHVEVNMREALNLGELCDIGLDAARYIAECSGQLHLPRAQRCRLGVGEFMHGCDMAPGQQDKPTGESGVESVGHPPMLIESDALAEW